MWRCERGCSPPSCSLTWRASRRRTPAAAWRTLCGGTARGTGRRGPASHPGCGYPTTCGQSSGTRSVNVRILYHILPVFNLWKIWNALTFIQRERFAGYWCPQLLRPKNSNSKLPSPVQLQFYDFFIVAKNHKHYLIPVPYTLFACFYEINSSQNSFSNPFQKPYSAAMLTLKNAQRKSPVTSTTPSKKFSKGTTPSNRKSPVTLTTPSKKICKVLWSFVYHQRAHTENADKKLLKTPRKILFMSWNCPPLTRREQCPPTGSGGYLTRPERRRRWCSSWPASHPGTCPSSSFPPSSRPLTPGAHAPRSTVFSLFSRESCWKFWSKQLL